jgi:hypothetical protein
MSRFMFEHYCNTLLYDPNVPPDQQRPEIDDFQIASYFKFTSLMTSCPVPNGIVMALQNCDITDIFCSCLYLENLHDDWTFRNYRRDEWLKILRIELRIRFEKLVPSNLAFHKKSVGELLNIMAEISRNKYSEVEGISSGEFLGFLTNEIELRKLKHIDYTSLFERVFENECTSSMKSQRTFEREYKWALEHPNDADAKNFLDLNWVEGVDESKAVEMGDRILKKITNTNKQNEDYKHPVAAEWTVHNEDISKWVQIHNDNVRREDYLAEYKRASDLLNSFWERK